MHRLGPLALLAGAAALVAGCSGSANPAAATRTPTASAARPASPPAGVRGTLMRMGGTLIPGGGTRPVPGMTVVFVRDGRPAASVRTSRRGGFAGRLAPGRYRIVIRGFGPPLGPGWVVVEPGRVSELRLDLDVI